MSASVTKINIFNYLGSVTVSDPEPVPENRTRRAVPDTDYVAEGEEKCRVDMWRCLSGVIEGGLHYIDSPDGIMG